MILNVKPAYALDGANAGAGAADTGEKPVANALYPGEGPESKDGAAKDAAAADAGKVDEKSVEKTDAEKAAEAEAQAKLAAEVPEDGKYDFKLPEGIELDEAVANIAMPLLKEAGVTRAEAAKLGPVYAQMREAEAKQLADNWNATQEGWQKAARGDKEFGGDKFDASLATAKAALGKYGTPELAQFLTETGAGNHPEVIRMMVKIGNVLSDDKPVEAVSNAAPNQGVTAKQLYPND